MVHAQIAAFNRHDVEALAAAVDEAFVWLDVVGDSVVPAVRGREAFAEGMRSYFDAFPDVRSEITGVSATGPFVSFTERVSWGAADNARTQASNAVYEVRDGLIRRVWYYPAVAGSTAGAGSAEAPERPATSVITLGTGTPYPNPERAGPATAVTYGDRVFLFDAGTGVVRRMNAAGLPISGPEAAFITHLHSDHTLGYPDLILTTWIMRRVRQLPVYGPPGLEAMTGHLLAAWEQDIRIRIDGLERELPDVYRPRVHEVGPGVVYDSAGVTITAFAVDHGSWEYAYGYRIDTPDRSVVIAGDARPSESVAEMARGADVLVHEVYPAHRVEPEDRPGGELWPEYMRAFHTSARELGALAAEARPGLLVLTHVIFSGGTAEEIVAGLRAGGWAGPTVVAEDLGRY